MIKSTIRKIINWSRDEGVESYSDKLGGAAPSKYMNKISERDNNFENGINLTVYKATGGKVICLHSYDPRTDRKQSSLYVITDKEDLGDELGQIITRECLTR